MEQKNKDDLVSIIVPVFNAEKYLKPCIDSILQQTYSKYELILVDDGSVDHSWEIIESYKEKVTNIVSLKKENGGSNSARKIGLESAKGEYVMFVDADDYVDKTICERLVDTLKTQQVEIVLSKMTKVLKNIPMEVSSCGIEERNSGIYFAENLIDTDIFYISNIDVGLVANIYKKNIIYNIFQHVDFRIDYGEDTACLLLALLDAKYVYLLNESLYYYRQNSSSITHLHLKSTVQSQKYLYQFLIPELKKRNVNPKIYKELEWIIMENLLSGGYELFKGKDYLYPFRQVSRNSDIIIYGAGVFGGELFRFVNQSHQFNLVLWIDQNWKIYQENGFPVSQIENVLKVHFDYIVIAVFKINIISEIRMNLIEIGIPSEKIIAIDQNLIAYKELPIDFWK